MSPWNYRAKASNTVKQAPGTNFFVRQSVARQGAARQPPTLAGVHPDEPCFSSRAREQATEKSARVSFPRWKAPANLKIVAVAPTQAEAAQQHVDRELVVIDMSWCEGYAAGQRR